MLIFSATPATPPKRPLPVDRQPKTLVSPLEQFRAVQIEAQPFQTVPNCTELL